MVFCGCCFPCFKAWCGLRPAGYTGRLSVWYGPVAGTYGVGSEHCMGKQMLDKWENGGRGGGLPPGCEGRGNQPSHVATFYLTVGDLPSKPGVIHQWHGAADRLSAQQKSALAKEICMTMFKGR